MSIPKSIYQMAEEEFGLPTGQFPCISLRSHELRAPIFFFYISLILEGLKNKIKGFRSPYDYR